MKRFFRTFAGKSVLFICCILCICAVAASAISAAIMVSRGFYTSTENEILSDFLKREFTGDGLSILRSFIDNYDDGIDSDNSNLIYSVFDDNGSVIKQSDGFIPNGDPLLSRNYGVRKNGSTSDIFVHYIGDDIYDDTDYYTVHFYLKAGVPENDEYALIYNLVHTAFSLRYAIYIIGFIALISAAVCFIALMCVTARRPDTDELFAGPLIKLPIDIMFILTLVSFIYATGIIYQINFDFHYFHFVLMFIYLNITLGLCISIAGRIKHGCLLKNTAVYFLIRIISKAIKGFAKLITSIPLIWRTVISIVVISFLEFLVLAIGYYETDVIMAWWFIEKLIIIPIVMYIAISLRKLAAAGDALGKGDFEHKTDTKGLILDFKRHGENLNGIAEGMNLAVEKQLKSERLKTELITNVSHDIKTPLTSVINYTSLIANEPCENEKIKEYSSVLLRQSEKLKRLIDDLVEASKASSGNLEVELVKCDASVFLTQADGEYAKRLEERNLTLITKCTEFPVFVMADSRRMWRIFDNLMNNICKYAQSNTRVYLTLEKVNNSAVITFKNTSKEALDISEEELMERFIRGDKSRNSDGNGLGLSIAKSLAELQGGALKLEIDGDLFKAILTFPAI